MFTRPDLNFDLVRFREEHARDHITLKNISSIPAEWSLKECEECLEVCLLTLDKKTRYWPLDSPLKRDEFKVRSRG